MARLLYEGEEQNIRDEHAILMGQIRDERDRIDQSNAQAKKDSLDRALEYLQYLAYMAARSDVPRDHPMGIASLDTVFATIRQLLLRDDQRWRGGDTDDDG